MIQLLNILDIRKYSQVSEQLNEDAFNAYLRTVQENQLNYLLKDSLFYDFFDFLENNWLISAETFTRESDTQIKAANIDLSLWIDYSLRLNNSTFVTIQYATFDGTDTIFTVFGNDLSLSKTQYVPDTLTSVDYKITRNYTDLLNGTIYIYGNNTIKYNGLRPLLSWYFLSELVTRGDLKHGDTGNFNILGENFISASGGQKRDVKTSYMNNALNENNKIVQFLNTKTSDFTLWSSTEKQNTSSLSWEII